MDCNHARLLLTLAGRDCQELVPSDVRLLDEHLEICPDCAVQARAERQLDQALTRAMSAVPVPAYLRARIRDAVAPPRKPRYWPWVAAAASLLLAVGLGGYWLLKPHDQFDPETFVYALDQNTAASPDSVVNFFHTEGLKVAAPRQFLYSYLESLDVQMVQGQRVGHLLFHFPGDARHASAVAHVYILPKRFVDLGEHVNPRFPTSTHTIEFLSQTDVDHPADHVYMVVYSGPSLAPFLAERARTRRT